MNKALSAVIVAFGLFLLGTPTLAKNPCANYSLTTFSGMTVRATVADYGKGPVCSYFKFGGSAKPALNKVGFFVPAIFQRGNCPYGIFDGQLCFLRKTPKKSFLYKNGFHAKPTKGTTCSYGMVFDGVNCFWRRAAYGTRAIETKGNWYSTPKLGCTFTARFPDGRPKPEIVLGSFDGNVCRIATRPAKASGVAIVQFKGAFYAVSDLPKTN